MVRGQLVLTPASQSFVERVTWENDVAAGWRPHDDRRSPVRIAPDVRFGKPSVGGVSTEVLWERTEGGEDQEELAEAFALSPPACAGRSPTSTLAGQREAAGQGGNRPLLLRR